MGFLFRRSGFFLDGPERLELAEPRARTCSSSLVTGLRLPMESGFSYLSSQQHTRSGSYLKFLLDGPLARIVHSLFKLYT